MLSALEEVCPSSISGPREGSISAESTALLEERTKIPMGKLYDSQRKNLKRRITKSLRTDREHWWVSKARELEKAGAIGDQRLLFQLICQTGPKKITVSEIITEKTGSYITNQHRRLERWADHFAEQFGWPQTTLPLEVAEWELTLTVNSDIPSVDETRSEIKLLKLNQSPGPDGLFPVLFKYGGNQQKQELTSLMQSVWVSEWTLSTVVPIFKKGSRTACENHRGISLISITSKLLSGLILRRLSVALGQATRENQAVFRPGRGCIDHIFTIRQIL